MYVRNKFRMLWFLDVKEINSLLNSRLFLTDGTKGDGPRSRKISSI